MNGEGKHITSQDIIAFLRPKLAGFKVPIYVDIRNEPLPRNANGKIQKIVLRPYMQAKIDAIRGTALTSPIEATIRIPGSKL